ncbi:MAG: PDZ domain-containing protein [Hormoscilla sp. SP5CHS1]|nr:PDZ domain-containing protein [Hormoscilla sp. SP12CHS1]MBC6455739.1 PDZ domain-containing protein [Hormoscilla sp. SP5CHS1]
MYKRLVWMGFSFLLPLAIALTSCSPAAEALTDNQKLFNEVWRIVNRAYLDDSFNSQNWWLVRQGTKKSSLATREQTYEAIDKMLDSLGDPYTRFLPPNEYKSLEISTSGDLTGVGLQIAMDGETGVLTAIAPIAGSPASAAGLQPLDLILKIDGVLTSSMTLEEAANRMRGPAGTLVTLTVEREGEAIFDVELVRDRITLNPVTAQLRVVEGQGNSLNIGYIRLSQFNANATQEVSDAIDRLEEEGAGAYILDLRNNPGGLLTAGIEIARLWLDDGTIVYAVNRQGILDSFDATGSALTDDPLVVLVNQGTASASEILAGALHDNHRALLVGEKTFGKGLIQSLFDLSDGSGLVVTIAKYETPDRTDINKLGIQPDKIVPLNQITLDQLGTEADQQYQAAVELLTSDMMLADAA